MEWTDEQEKNAIELIKLNSSEILPSYIKGTDIIMFYRSDYYEFKSKNFWNDFYYKHETNFFKNRTWLKIEFPELFTPIRNLFVIF